MDHVGISFETPLRVILETAPPAPVEPRAIITLQFAENTIKGESMSASMRVGTYATVSVEWTDKGGNTVGVEHGTVNWASSDPTICTVTPSTGNPAIANLYAPGKIGTVQIHATGDADLGEGVKNVTATLAVEVISGEAVAGEITFTQSPGQGAEGASSTAPAGTGGHPSHGGPSGGSSSAAPKQHDAKSSSSASD